MTRKSLALLLTLALLLPLCLPAVPVHAASSLSPSLADGEWISSYDDPSISWNDVDGAAGYRISVRNLGTNELTVDYRWTTGTSYSLSSALDQAACSYRIWIGAMESKSEKDADYAITYETITVYTTPEAPTVEDADWIDRTHDSVTLSMNVTRDGGSTITDTGFYFIRTSRPTSERLTYSTGRGKGEKTVTVTGLDPDTKYHFWAYAVNGVGETVTKRYSVTTEEYDCPHTGGTYTKPSPNEVSYENTGDADEHKIINYYHAYCEDCGDLMEKRAVKETDYGAHEFRSGVCTLCTYAKGCAHTSTTRDYYETTYDSLGDEGHEKHRFYNEICDDCGETVGLNYRFETSEESHTLSGGTCRYCGYTKGEPLSIFMLRVSTNTAKVGDTVSATVDTTGGSGDLRYAWEVWCDGTRIDRTDLSATKNYSFTAKSGGTYTFSVTVQDAQRGDSVKGESDPITVTAPTPTTPTEPTEPSGPSHSPLPEEPDTPVTPDTPDVPDTPVTPDTPDIPDTPDTPDTPTVCAHNFVREETDTKLINQNLDEHDRVTTYREVCSVCNAVGASGTETVREAHDYNFKFPYPEEAHPHKKYVLCDCGATQYINSGVSVNEADCTTCHPKPACSHAEIREVLSVGYVPLFGSSSRHQVVTRVHITCGCGFRNLTKTEIKTEEHDYGVYYDDSLVKHEFCPDCTPRTDAQKEQDMKNFDRYIRETLAELREQDIEKAVALTDSASVFLASQRKANETWYRQVAAYSYNTVTFRWDNVVKKAIPGSETVNELRRQALISALQAYSGASDLPPRTTEFENTIMEIGLGTIDLMESQAADAVRALLKDKNFKNFLKAIKQDSSLRDMVVENLENFKLPDSLRYDAAFAFCDSLLESSFDLIQYINWDSNKRNLFLTFSNDAFAYLSLMQQLSHYCADDPIVKDYCDDMIDTLDAFLRGGLADAVNEMDGQMWADVSFIVVKNICENGLNFVLEKGAGALLEIAVGADAVNVLALVGALGGLTADFVAGTGETSETLEDLDILYTSIEQSALMYHEAEKADATDAALNVLQLYILNQKIAGLEASKNLYKSWGRQNKDLVEPLTSLCESYQRTFEKLATP